MSESLRNDNIYITLSMFAYHVQNVSSSKKLDYIFSSEGKTI